MFLYDPIYLVIIASYVNYATLISNQLLQCLSHLCKCLSIQYTVIDMKSFINTISDVTQMLKASFLNLGPTRFLSNIISASFSSLKYQTKRFLQYH